MIHLAVSFLLAALAASTFVPTALGPNITLRDGVVMPTVGLGSSGGCHPDPNGTEKTCPGYKNALQAMKLGYRSFHDALSYGNQAGLGAAVMDSGIPREQLFVMSMVPKYLMGYNETKAAVQASLAQLQVSYIDLMMVHHRAADIGEWPRKSKEMKAFPDNWAREGSPVGGQWLPPACAVSDPTWQQCQDETWLALTELKKAGKLRSIGVSNWMVPNLKRMVALGVELPSVNQIEQHVGWHDDEMLAFCKEHSIIVQAATPLARSMKELVQAGGNAQITKLAQKYNKTPAQISLRYLIEKGVAIIPSAHDPAYQQQNLDLFTPGFTLTSTEVQALGSIALICRKYCTTSNSSSYYCHKCWGDPADLMCGDASTGSMFHCP